jgi:hypothetical protein
MGSSCLPPQDGQSSGQSPGIPTPALGYHKTTARPPQLTWRWSFFFYLPVVQNKVGQFTGSSAAARGLVLDIQSSTIQYRSD